MDTCWWGQVLNCVLSVPEKQGNSSPVVYKLRLKLFLSFCQTIFNVHYALKGFLKLHDRGTWSIMENRLSAMLQTPPDRLW